MKFKLISNFMTGLLNYSCYEPKKILMSNYRLSLQNE